VSAWPIVVAGAVLLGVGGAARSELAAWLTAERAVRLRAQAKPIVDRRIEHLDGQVELPQLATILALDLASRETAALVIAPDGRPLAAAPADGGTPGAEALAPERYAPAFDGDPHATYVTRGPNGERLLHALIPPRAWLPRPPAVVHLVADLAPERRLLDALVRVLALTLLATVAVAAALALALGGAWPLLALLAIAPAVLAARPLLRAAAADAAPPPREIAPAPPPRRERDGDAPTPPAASPPEGVSRDDFTAAMRRVEAAFLAREASEARMRRFVADASHDLRTPLTAVGGAADVLLHGAKDDPEQVERLARLVRAKADAMGRLVEDLLLLARLDAGDRLERAPVDLGALVREHGEELRLAAPGRDVAVEADDGVRTSGNADRLRQVLANLTENALRHGGPDGPITLSARHEDDHAVLAVSDAGPGIAPADRERIFERFWRADAARGTEGSGLGLAIVREIVAAHGGTVDVASEPGAGTTFAVRLSSANRQE
jgi:two-component system, OmpR family, sensor kinase